MCSPREPQTGEIPALIKTRLSEGADTVPETSIVITGKDNFTQVVTTMRNANQRFDKDLSGLQTKLDTLNRTKISLKVDVAKAQSELKDAEKQFIKTGDAADKLKLEMANQNYENANRNLKLVSSNARQAEKDMASLTTTVSKSENRAGSGKTSDSSLLSTLGASGASAFLGNAASQIAGAYVSSAYGDEAGTMFSSTLSGAGVGAAIGTALAPGIGTAIGALGGAVVGAVQGMTANQQKKDDAFKDYYKGLYDTVTGDQADSLSNGSSIAASRETTMLSFKTLLGSVEKAGGFVDELKTMAAKTPFEFSDLTSISKTLLSFHYSEDEALKTMNAVGEAGSALDLDASSMKDMATYMGRMNVTGKTTMEYLNPLLERGVDVYAALAKLPSVTGKTNAQIQEMVTKGLIPGADAAKAISDYMADTYSGSMEAQSKTFAGLQSTLADAKSERDNAMGEGYNEERKSGIQSEIANLTGENGQKMQDVYKQIGIGKAALENLQNQLSNDAVNSVLSGNVSDSFAESDQLPRLKELVQEYKLAQAELYDANKSGDTTSIEKARYKMGSSLAEAEAMGISEFQNSEGFKAQTESNIALANSIREDASVNDAWQNAGYSLSKAFTRGMQKGLDTTTLNIPTPFSENSGIGGSTATSGGTLVGGNNTGGAAGASLSTVGIHVGAYGFNYIPYDNYPALLHEGERVLTASEARGYGNSAPSVSFPGAIITVREEADIDKIASALAAKVRRAQLLAVD